MRIGAFTTVLGDRPFEAVLDRLAGLGFEAVEVGVGGYPGAEHCDAAALLADPAAARRWREAVESRGMVVSALSAHANPLHPDADVAAEARRVLDEALALAERLEVGVVNAFSGCPGDGPGARVPNWVSTPWPEDFAATLAWQWEACAVPYWTEVAALAERRGVRIGIEPHPGFLVYNLRTLLALREATGPAIAANFDPSHLWWQQADPVAVVRALGEAGAIAHVHAKDTWLDPGLVRLNGVIETLTPDRLPERAWTFRSVGHGHSEQAWRDIVTALTVAGYDGVLSVEQEDRLLDAEDGLATALDVLRRVLPVRA